MVAMASTREAYGKVLRELGGQYPDIVVLGGDLNKSTLTTFFAQEFPERFFDFGAAEQNIISAAAGFASSGKIPFVSTFAVFGTGRAYDQLRVGVAQPHLNVKLVLTHAGILTGEDGMSAQAIEDLALICALPGFTVLVPADAEETVRAVRVAAEREGPFYIRLCRPPTPIVHPDGACSFTLGKAETMRNGGDVGIVACGVMVAAALEAAQALESEGISCRVLNMHTLSPLDQEAVRKAAEETGALVTAEEHYIHGGLGSLVAQEVALHHPVPLEMMALRGYGESGKPDELLEKYGLTSGHLADAVRRVVARKG